MVWGAGGVPTDAPKTQSVMDALVSGTRMARPLSLPFSSGKMRAIAVAEPVEVGACGNDSSAAGALR